jgi:hypothetical protein
MSASVALMRNRWQGRSLRATRFVRTGVWNYGPQKVVSRGGLSTAGAVSAYLEASSHGTLASE